MIAVRDGKHCCYRMVDGRRHHYYGCAHETPRQAIAHIANLEPFVSPLRVPGSEPSVTGSSPSLGTGSLPERRRRGSRLGSRS